MSVSRRDLLKLLGAACAAAALPESTFTREDLFGAERGWQQRGSMLVQWGSVAKGGTTTFPLAMPRSPVSVQLSHGFMIGVPSATGFQGSEPGAKWVAVGKA